VLSKPFASYLLGEPQQFVELNTRVSRDCTRDAEYFEASTWFKKHRVQLTPKKLAFSKDLAAS